MNLPFVFGDGLDPMPSTPAGPTLPLASGGYHYQDGSPGHLHQDPSTPTSSSQGSFDHSPDMEPAVTAITAPDPARRVTLPPLPSNRNIMTCLIDNCGQSVFVNRQHLKYHLAVVHAYPEKKHGTTVECRWAGCTCKRKGGSGCKGRADGHGQHGEDIVDHVWEKHLNFADLCKMCGRAISSYEFSMARHESSCSGRKKARCRRCFQLFSSQVALSGHHELGLCTSVTRGRT
jgi:hypothetical protein